MRLHARSLIRVLKAHDIDPTIGVEVGVYRGHTSVALLKTFSSLKLVMVDPWMEWDPDSDYFKTTRIGKRTEGEWNEHKAEALELTKPFADRIVIRQMQSSDCAGGYPDDHFDFAFIDADHTYEAVREDISLWRPKVRSGGILAGHDYDGRMDRRGVWGVKRAADEFAATEGLEIHTETGKLWWVQIA